MEQGLLPLVGDSPNCVVIGAQTCLEESKFTYVASIVSLCIVKIFSMSAIPSFTCFWLLGLLGKICNVPSSVV